MSLWCECPECGGNDQYAICENKLLSAWVQAYGTKQTVHSEPNSSITEVCLIAKKSEDSLSNIATPSKKVTIFTIVFFVIAIIFL